VIIEFRKNVPCKMEEKGKKYKKKGTNYVFAKLTPVVFFLFPLYINGQITVFSTFSEAARLHGFPQNLKAIDE
jgi:hypothetical protein